MVTDQAPQLRYNALHLKSTSVTVRAISPTLKTRLAEVDILPFGGLV
jgi:hypothetical protein